MTTPLLAGRELRKYFEVKAPFSIWRKSILRAVDGVDMEIYEKETFGLVGESGCGKSTLGRLCLRLLKPTAGRVIFLERDITELPERKLKNLRGQMQIILQNPYASLNPRMRVGRSVAEGLEVHNIYKGKERMEAVMSMFQTVGLPRDYIHKFPHELSGGERQRVCIARALILNPRFVVADEPVSALDVTIQNQIISLLINLQERLQLSLLFITHDLRIVRHITKRTAVMYLGKIMELAGTDELFRNPLHPYTRVLLSSIPPSHPDEKKNRIPIKGDVPTATAIPSGCRFHPRCRHAFERCPHEVPELKEVATNHWVACFLVD